MTIQVTVRCFSHVREALGKDVLKLELEDDTDTSTVENKIREMAGDNLDGITLRVAVNREYMPEPIVLKNGDEVALIPPVQGG
ncbi:MAG: MoaD/ThiS family protein [Candidatus Marinimicrobia bacterium]|jgi:molybdopterin synthase sulfur carrier subunit|nr:MoaD/ThiS family protein [Candidatus Neomarinimicrobiota bacterium]|tara:strand:- start:221 stop:469 length:249 start_codon:yes stop_codon:yes gene_type:complete